ncbi:MAG: hypothetical protein Q9168_003812 [Polycauliona sp. 1 TL-2023]
MDTFPFQKLPAELQIEVLRAALPQRAILPSNSKHAYEGDAASGRETMSSSLLLVSKVVSAEIERHIQRNIFVVIEVNAFKPFQASFVPSTILSYLDKSINIGRIIRGPLTESERKLLENVRNIEFAPMIGSDVRRGLWWFTIPPWSLGGRLGSTVIQEREEYKETARFVCDTLKDCCPLQRLNIRLPCLCTLQPDEVATATWYLLNMLSPLRRLRVTHQTTFEVRHDDRHLSHPINRPITHSDTTAAPLLNALTTEYGHLIGEELDGKEKTWKDMKDLLMSNDAQSKFTKKMVDDMLFLIYGSLIMPQKDFENAVNVCQRMFMSQTRRRRASKK